MESFNTKDFLNKKDESLELGDIIQKLHYFQENVNNGKGLTCIGDIINNLNEGNIAGARIVCGWEHNKIDDYPEIKELLKNNLFRDQKDDPWSISEDIESNVSNR